MKKRLVVYTVAAFLNAASSQLMASCGATTVMSTEDNGKRIELVLDGAAVAKTQAWTPTSGEPPLSVSKAAAAALAWAKVRYERYDTVKITELSLKEFSCFSLLDRWYYHVEFSPIIDGNRLFGPGNWAAVLMDGTVVGPKETSTRTNASPDRTRER